MQQRSGSDRRSAPRYKRLRACELEVAGRRLPATILNLSETGLFVATSLVPPAEEDVLVHIRTPDGSGTMLVRTRLVRRRVVPQNLGHLERPGLGLRIVSAPAEYRDLIWSEAPKWETAPTVPEPTCASTEPLTYTVHVTEVSGRRSKELTVQACSEQEAALRVHEELGAEWMIVDLKRD